MSLSFALIAIVTITASVAAMSLRNLVHCALSLTVAFTGLAAAYLQLNAQFVGFAQILVYVGAVAILIVFAILLTRGSEPAGERMVSPGGTAGIVVAAAVLAVLVYAIDNSSILHRPTTPAPRATVHEIGDALMTRFVLPLEVVGLLLTAALIGAVIIALREKPEDRSAKPEAAGSIGNRKSEIGNHP
jgi:NADH:ubiquinone oxidoreductase subunit 6 (subunit J)